MQNQFYTKSRNKDRVYKIPRFFFYIGLLTIGQTVLRPALSFTVSDWFFLLSLLLTISESLMRRSLEIKFPPMMILGLFFFSIGGIISSGFSIMPLTSILALIKYIYLIAIWFWLGTILLTSPIHIRTSITLWITSAAISGLGALIQFVWGDVIPGTSPAWGRMTGMTEHVNDLGGLTSVALVPAIMMLTQVKTSFLHTIYSWFCVICITAGLLLSVSMSGIVALLISLLIWMAIIRFTLRKLILLVVSAVVFLAVISLQSQLEGFSVITRVNEISNDGLSLLTLQTRIDTFFAAWEVIKESPVIGVGLGPTIGLTKTGYVVHNIVLLNWFESGVFGLAGMLMILLSIVLLAVSGMRDPDRITYRVFGIALFSSYIAFLVLGLVQPIYYKRFGWISASLLVALYSGRNRYVGKNGKFFLPVHPRNYL